MHTNIYKDLDVNSPELLEAAEILRQGGLVAFPTETVYGIAARADSSTVETLSDLKDRSEGKYYSLHIAKPQDVYNYVSNPSLRCRKIVDNLWPGPLTLVFKIPEEQMQGQIKKVAKKWDAIYHNCTVGVRCPDHEIASKLLELAGVPVVATSANMSGQPPLVDGEDVIKFFDGRIDAIIDGGSCQESLSSTVAMIDQAKVNILRQGTVSQQEIIDISSVKLFFVCDSNTLASPIAAEICKKQIAQMLSCSSEDLLQHGYKIQSAGVKMPIAKPATDIAIEYARSIGANLENHITTPLSSDDLYCSDAIFVMEEKQKQRILDFYPQLADKCYLLCEGYDICEPEDNEIVFKNFIGILEDSIKERLGEIVL